MLVIQKDAYLMHGSFGLLAGIYHIGGIGCADFTLLVFNGLRELYIVETQLYSQSSQGTHYGWEVPQKVVSDNVTIFFQLGLRILLSKKFFCLKSAIIRAKLIWFVVTLPTLVCLYPGRIQKHFLRGYELDFI